MHPPARVHVCAWRVCLLVCPSISGDPFVKRSQWEGANLRTVAKDVKGKKADFVTVRRIDEHGHLIQTNWHGSAQFERVFARKDH